MRKTILLILITMVVGLFGCTTTEEPTPTPTPMPTPQEPTPTETEIDPIEQLFLDSSSMDNYTLTVLIFHQLDVYTLTIKMTNDLVSLDMEGQIEYFQKDDELCRHHLPTNTGYVIDVISCEDQQTMTYRFFDAFQQTWFSEVDGKYYLNLEHYQALTAFFGQTMDDAVVANFELILGDHYFEQFKFDILVNELLYRLDMTFSDIGETVVVLPTEG